MDQVLSYLQENRGRKVAVQTEVSLLELSNVSEILEEIVNSPLSS